MYFFEYREFVASSTVRPRGDLGRTTTVNNYGALRTTEFIPSGRGGNKMIVVSTPMYAIIITF